MNSYAKAGIAALAIGGGVATGVLLTPKVAMVQQPSSMQSVAPMADKPSAEVEAYFAHKRHRREECMQCSKKRSEHDCAHLCVE